MSNPTKKIERLMYSGDSFDVFNGYCEALVVRNSIDTSFMLHRYYEHHVILYKKKYRVKEF